MPQIRQISTALMMSSALLFTGGCAYSSPDTNPAPAVVEFTETVTPSPSPTPTPSPKKSAASIAPMPEEELNAIAVAQFYLEIGVSESGLLHFLMVEGFSEEIALEVLEGLDVDWNDQALIAAQAYVIPGSTTASMVRSGLQVEGFTDSQIEYALANVTGLVPEELIDPEEYEEYEETYTETEVYEEYVYSEESEEDVYSEEDLAEIEQEYEDSLSEIEEEYDDSLSDLEEDLYSDSYEENSPVSPTP